MFVWTVCDIFNGYDARLKFTHEIEVNNVLNFLDVSLIRHGDKLISNWFRKPSSSDRTLSFKSNHTLHLKRNIVFNLVDRAIILSHEMFHDDNIKIVNDILIKNSYDQKFVDKHIKARLRKIKFSNHNNINCNNKSINDNSKFLFTLPISYNNNRIFNMCSRILNRHNIHAIPRFNNKLDQIIKLGKDPTKKSHQTNVVYKLNCLDCPSTYIGETKRELRVRLYDHKSKVDSLVFLHAHDTGHNFDWKKTQILDRESVKTKRLLAESFYINCNEHTINKKEDSQFLNRIYKNLIKSIPNEL